MLITEHYLPYNDICTCTGTKQLDIHKTCAVTLTGKRPPNCNPELQLKELVQDTEALMVQDTNGGYKWVKQIPGLGHSSGAV